MLCVALARTLSAAPATVQFQGRPAELRICLAGQHSLRIALVPATAGAEAAEFLRSPMLVEREWPPPALRLRAIEGGTNSRIGPFQVAVKANPLAVRVSNSSGQLVQELEFDARGNEMTFSCDDGGPVLGLGEGGRQFDRRGAAYEPRNGQGPDTATNGARIEVPLLIGTKGWALFVPAPEGRFDLTGRRGIFQASSTAPPGFDVFMFDARQPMDLMREYSQLTGRAALPPKWALGYMQSHRTLVNDEQMVEIAQTFREKKLPCDALIYLGTGFCPAGWNTGHDSFEFNPDVFCRNPSEVLQDLHARNMRVVLHVVPEWGGQLHGSIPPAPGGQLDTTHIAEYWKRHEPVFAQGVDGWWPDEGDWMSRASRLARHRLYSEGPLQDRPNERPWSLHRNGCAGIARYGGWVWSGDVAATWATLANQIAVGVNSSLSLSPYWGTDTGGFFNTKESTGELYARWFQFSTFCPLFRSHGRAWQTRLPWGWNTGDAGPMEDQKFPVPAELQNAAVEPVCRKYLELRYALMPYTYTLAREAHDTGLPLMRSLWLHYPDDPQAAREGGEYLWGRDILVAPVVERGADGRDLYLPEGDWYDWWTAAKVAGGRNIRAQVNLETMPLYARAGAIIPLDPPRQYVDQPTQEPMTLRVYRGSDGRFVLYEDDGKTLDYQRGGEPVDDFHLARGEPAIGNDA